MARFGMVIDTRQCIGCQDCVVACNIENNVPPGKRRGWVRTEVQGRFPDLSMRFYSERCNHCDEPPCVPVCPVGASHVSSLGKTVQIHYDKCIKCGLCVEACPYQARFMNELRDGTADKCTFCAHRLKEGKEPACAAVCPTKAIFFGDLDNPRSKLNELLRTRKHEVLKPDKGTKPRIYYLV
ncbi:MAG: 4Fe-4S dicluster domain-containing protein [Pseudomonadota bacterium]